MMWVGVALVGSFLALLALWNVRDQSYEIPVYVKLPELASTRAERFPSVDERVKVYMGNWYAPPCEGYEDGRIYYHYEKTSKGIMAVIRESWDRRNVSANAKDFYSFVDADVAFFLERDTMVNCTGSERLDLTPEEFQMQRRLMGFYCADVVNSMFTALNHFSWENGQLNSEIEVPVLLQFGDVRYSTVHRFLDLPVIKKYRVSTTREQLEKVASPACVNGPRELMETARPAEHLQPIVWKLGSHRHFGYRVQKVYRHDIPWEKKQDRAIFRGQLTGYTEAFNQNHSDYWNCMNLRRCRLVYEHDSSHLIDARLTSTKHIMNDVVRGVTLTTKSITIRRLLEYKGIIMLEGNDVSSGLKWALLSQSVVLMPEPRHTSWAMEELLEPWVHYVPLNANGSDAEPKMQWVLNNQEHAQRISERATLWMQDLVLHPDSAEDDRLVEEEILRRYAAHFSRRTIF